MADVSVHPRTLASGEVRWRLKWRRIDGTQKVATFHTEATARRWEAIFRDDGIVEGERQLEAADSEPRVVAETVSAMVERHIGLLTGIEPGTKGKYRSQARLYIEPTIGALPLADLTRDVVAEWINFLDERDLSGKTIKNVHGLLSAACTRAVDDDRLPKNPARGLKLPPNKRRPPVFLSPEEVARLLAAIGPRYRDLVIVLLGTGMRFGEATALRCWHVQRTAGGMTLNVSEAWKFVTEGPMRSGGPKTLRGTRKIHVKAGRPAHDALLREMDGKAEGDLVFQSPKGLTVRQGEFHDRWWGPAMLKLGWKDSPRRPRPHDLRHTAASFMLAEGMEIAAVSRVLGHENISTTVNIYGSVRDEAAVSAVDALGGVLDRIMALDLSETG